MNTQEEFIVSLYDEHVRGTGAETKSADAIEAIRPAVIDAISNAPRDLDAEADRLIRQIIGSTRQRRTTALKRDLEWFLDSAMPETGDYIDPLLDRAYGLGRADGSDKTLRYWTPEDFRFLVVTRYRVAAEQASAAKEFDAIVERVVDRMTEQETSTFGAMHWSD